MSSENELYSVICNDTKSVFFTGSLENCRINCCQTNALYDFEKFVIVPHKSGGYVDLLIKRSDLVRVILPKQKHESPPKLIPEPTVKERIKDYLNNLKTA